MIDALCALLICQLTGDAISRLLQLALPGPLIGMLLLLGWLVWRGGPAEGFERFTKQLLGYLSMLFIPAAAGLMTDLRLLEADWWRIGVAVLVSTSIGLGSAAWVMNALMKEERT
jgi:holin-like protein